MVPTSIASLADLRLDPYRSLRDRPLYEDSGKFIAESSVVVRRLLASSLEVLSVLSSRRKIAEIADCLRPDVPTYLVDDALVESLVGFPFHRGVLALAVRPPPPVLPAQLRRVLVLEDLVDVDNVGA